MIWGIDYWTQNTKSFLFKLIQLINGYIYYSTDKPAHRIADKIAENFNNALLVVIDNKELTFNMNSVPFKISQYADGKWKVKDKAEWVFFFIQLELNA